MRNKADFPNLNTKTPDGIAPGGRHMTVTQPDNAGRRFIALNDDPPENSVRPSADVRADVQRFGADKGCQPGGDRHGRLYAHVFRVGWV